jgi:hypothetical protein
MVNEKMISNLHSQLLTVDQLLAALQAQCVIAVQRQWAHPFSVDAQDPQLLAMTGQVGGARGVHMQTI